MRKPQLFTKTTLRRWSAHRRIWVSPPRSINGTVSGPDGIGRVYIFPGQISSPTCAAFCGRAWVRLRIHDVVIGSVGVADREARAETTETAQCVSRLCFLTGWREELRFNLYSRKLQSIFSQLAILMAFMTTILLSPFRRL